VTEKANENILVIKDVLLWAYSTRSCKLTSYI